MGGKQAECTVGEGDPFHDDDGAFTDFELTAGAPKEFLPSSGILGDNCDDFSDGGVGREPSFDVGVINVGSGSLGIGTSLLGVGDEERDTDGVVGVEHGGGCGCASS